MYVNRFEAFIMIKYRTEGLKNLEQIYNKVKILVRAGILLVIKWNRNSCKW